MKRRGLELDRRLKPRPIWPDVLVGLALLAIFWAGVIAYCLWVWGW